MTGVSFGTDAALDRASLLCDQHRDGEALRILHSVIAGNPASVRAWCLISIAHGNLEEHELAAQAAGRAASLAPLAAEPLVLLSQALSMLDRKAEALETAERAVWVDPTNLTAHAQLAIVLADARRHRQAHRVARFVVSQAPNDAASHQLMSAVALIRGRRRRAKVHAARALSLEPDDPTAHRLLGSAELGRLRYLDPRRMATSTNRAVDAARLDPRAPLAGSFVDSMLTLTLFAQTVIVLIACRILYALSQRNPMTLIPPLVAALAVLPLAWFTITVRRMAPEARTRLRRLVRRPRTLAALVLDVGALIALVAGGVASPHDMRTPIMVAGLSATTAAVLAFFEVHRAGAVVEGRVRRIVSTPTLVVVAMTFALVGLVIYGTAVNRSAGNIAGAVCGLIALALVVHAVRRP